MEKLQVTLSIHIDVFAIKGTLENCKYLKAEKSLHEALSGADKGDVFDYIETFGNSKRRRGMNVSLSPVEYERN